MSIDSILFVRFCASRSFIIRFSLSTKTSPLSVFSEINSLIVRTLGFAFSLLNGWCAVAEFRAVRPPPHRQTSRRLMIRVAGLLLRISIFFLQQQRRFEQYLDLRAHGRDRDQLEPDWLLPDHLVFTSHSRRSALQVSRRALCSSVMFFKVLFRTGACITCTSLAAGNDDASDASDDGTPGRSVTVPLGCSTTPRSSTPRTSPTPCTCCRAEEGHQSCRIVARARRNR